MVPNLPAGAGPVHLSDVFGAPYEMLFDAARRGHTVLEVPMPSGLQAIERTAEGYFGGADPRREGIVLGD